jgi:hypothetical protein
MVLLWLLSPTGRSHCSTLNVKRDRGIIPRVVKDLFHVLASEYDEACEVTVYCSFMQMYNERIFDLLAGGDGPPLPPGAVGGGSSSLSQQQLQQQQSQQHKALAIREHGVGFQREVFVAGLSEFRVAGLDDVMALLHQGTRNRVVRSTEMNEASSRSHAILRLAINVVSQHPTDHRTVIRRAKLNLVRISTS